MTASTELVEQVLLIVQYSIAPFAIDHDILASRFIMPSLTASTNQPPSHPRSDCQLGIIQRANRVSYWQAAARHARIPRMLRLYLSGVKLAEETVAKGSTQIESSRHSYAELPTYQWSPARDVLGILPCHSCSLCVWPYIAPFPPASSSSQPNRRIPNPYHTPLDSPFLLALAPATSPAQSFGYHFTRFPAKAD